MHTFLPRNATQHVIDYLAQFPAVALLGPRQCGKTTLARALLEHRSDAVFLDLERASDLRKLTDPELYFAAAPRLVCLDEVQLLPQLFAALRSILDRGRRPGQVLLLGSASEALVNASAESLAGRIGYIELAGFSAAELAAAAHDDWPRRAVRGGYPPSYLARDDRRSLIWREQFINSFLQRDLPQLGFRTAAPILRRFWAMCAVSHGQILNRSKMATAMGVDEKSVGRYLSMLEETFILRILPPFFGNLKKRLVKSPKLYVRDSGLLNAFLGCHSYHDILGHTSFGAIWEGLVVEEVLGVLPFGWTASFYRSSTGNELDLVLEKGQKRWAIECKGSSAPSIGRGFHTACSDLDIERAWVVAPINETYPMAPNVTACNLSSIAAEITRVL